MVDHITFQRALEMARDSGLKWIVDEWLQFDSEADGFDEDSKPSGVCVLGAAAIACKPETKALDAWTGLDKFRPEYFTPADTAQLVKDAIGDDAFLLLGFIPAFNDEQLRDLLEDEFFHRHPELDWDSVSASVLADDATSNDLDTFYIAEEAFLDHLNSPNIWDTIITVLHDHYPSALELELCPLEGCDDCDE